MPTINLKKLRLSAGKTQGEIAELLGIERSYLSRIERGERDIDLSLLERWLSACGFSFELVIAEDSDLQIIRALSALLPRLSIDDRRTLIGLLDIWKLSYLSLEIEGIGKKTVNKEKI